MRWIVAACSIVLAGCYASHVRDGDDVDAGVVDARAPQPDGDAAPDAGPPIDAGPICALPAANADVAGATPIGPIRFDYAYAGRGNGTHACFEVALHLTDSASLASTPENDLWAWIPRSEEPLGVHTNVTFTLALGGATAGTTTGVVEILRYTRDATPPALEARITIDGEGWSVAGTIVAPYCSIFGDPCL